MSLDDKVLDKNLVQLTFDGLETIYLASERVSESDSYSRELKMRAFAYMREYDRCVMLEKPSNELRENFVHIANLVVSKTKSPMHETFNLLGFGCAGVTLYSMMRWWYAPSNNQDAQSWFSTALLGVFGIVATRVMRDYFDKMEYRNLRRTAGRVVDAADDVWAEALSMIHEKKFKEYK